MSANLFPVHAKTIRQQVPKQMAAIKKIQLTDKSIGIVYSNHLDEVHDKLYGMMKGATMCQNSICYLNYESLDLLYHQFT